MRHIFEVKVPNLFKKKGKGTTDEEQTVKLFEKEDDKFTLDPKVKQALIVGGTLTAGLIIGHKVGYKRGLEKAGPVVVNVIK